VQQVPVKKLDKMETFWLSETLSECMLAQCRLKSKEQQEGVARSGKDKVANVQNICICYLTIQAISAWTRWSSTPR
jgi:hypothetical protein